jgi:hypothetical protein
MADYPLISGVSTVNSSAVALGIGGVFTGTSIDVSCCSTISVSVFANVASATNGLSMQQSSDGTNWDITDTFTVPAATGKTYSVPRVAKFARVVYTNGAVAQASFRLQTITSIEAPNSSSVKPQDARSNENDFVEVVNAPMLYDNVTDSWSRDRGGHTRNRVGQYAATTFRTAALASALHNIFTIENPTGSGKIMYIKSITFTLDTLAALAGSAPTVKLSKLAALPTLGTVITSTKWKTSDATAVGIVRCSTSSDGGAVTAITATAGVVINAIFQNKFQTAAGYIIQTVQELLPNIDRHRDPYVLVAGESLLVQVPIASTVTNAYLLTVVWEEGT